jgi:predicted DCC family thiol-disulfide oxidoreductase YuxK
MNAPDAMDERPATTKLTILYDERCAVCRRARDWLLTQPCFVEVELLPAGSVEASERYGSLPWLGQELIAVDDQGRAWVGPAAFIAAMWATRNYRAWAYRLSRPTLAPHAEHFFHWISKKRDQWSVWLGRQEDLDCSWCDGARVTGAL